MPRALRILLPQETPDQRAVCVQHDQAYHAGGTRRDRAIADANLLFGLLITGMDVDRAHQYHVAVRVVGKSHFGNGHYTDEPVPAPPEKVEAP